MVDQQVDVASVHVVDPQPARLPRGEEQKSLPQHAGDQPKQNASTPVKKGGAGGWIWSLLILAVLGVGIYLLVRNAQAREAQENKVPAPRPTPVSVAKSRQQNVEVFLDEIATVTALNTVNVQSRVDGQMIKVNFKEGQRVQKGDLLMQIDPRPYQAALEQAQGTLAKDQAQLTNAKADLTRYQEAKEAVSDQQLVTAQATVDQYAGTVKTDQGAVDNAKLNIVYCNITSPLDGIIGLRAVDEGNMIRSADSTALAVITQLEPITVVFSVSSDELPPVLKRMQAKSPIVVDVFNRDLTQKLATGKVEATESQIDQTTGKLKFKALFDNKDHALFPNQFVNARMYIRTMENVVTIPTPALQIGTELGSYFVYVVQPGPGPEESNKGKGQAASSEKPAAEEEEVPAAGASGKKSGPREPVSHVEVRDVVAGVQQGDTTVITSGLKEGESVVTQGVDKLKDGANVTTSAPASAGGSATQGGSAVRAKVRKTKSVQEGDAPTQTGHTPDEEEGPGRTQPPTSQAAVKENE